MSSKKKGGHCTSRLWMVDWIGGYVLVSKGGLEFKFPYLRDKSWFNIDAASLMAKLKNICERSSGAVIEGKLRFWGHKLGENREGLLVIEPLDLEDPDFSFEISLEDFMTALDSVLKI